MEMSNLNSHLFAIQKVASPSCSCGYYNETINHYVLQCPNYTNQRNILFQNLAEILSPDFENKLQQEQLETLVFGKNIGGCGDRQVASHFQNYLLQSKRFAEPF